MKDSLYVKLDDHTEYRKTISQINELLDTLDKKMSRLEEIKDEEETYIETWKQKSEEIRSKVSDTTEILDANRPR